MPERGLGVKNVVFCGIRARSTAAAAGLRDRHRAAEDGGARRTLVDEGGDGTRVVPVAPGRLGERGDHERLDHRGVGGGHRRRARRRARPLSRSGRASASANPPRSTTPRACSASIRAWNPGTASGEEGPASTTSNASPRPGPQIDAGGEVDQAVDRLDVELVVGELHDEHHDRPRAADGFAGGAELVAVGAGGLEPVVTVGEHELGGADELVGSARRERDHRSRRARARRRRRRCRSRARGRGRGAR